MNGQTVIIKGWRYEVADRAAVLQQYRWERRLGRSRRDARMTLYCIIDAACHRERVRREVPA